MDEFILRALLGVLCLAAVLGPLGSFVVWRRMAYFGDTVAHSALLGVALSLLSGERVPMQAAILLVAVAVALLLSRSARDARFHADTLLGILAHGALALGVLLVALSRDIRVDLNLYLFGDILGVSWQELGVLAAMALGVLGTIHHFWRPLLMATIEPNIAAVEGVNIRRMQLLLTLLLAIVIALAIKLTGVLLITALLIIPAASARCLATSPRQMAIFASFIGTVAGFLGLFASLQIDTPTGPTMVAAAAVMFVICSLIRRKT